MKFNEIPPVPVDGAERQVKETTAGDWGNRLPLGFLTDGNLHRDFAFRTYKSSTERALDEKRRATKGMNQIEWAATVLATMLTQLGPYRLDDIDEMARKSLVLSCWMPDVLYMLIRLRTEAMGSEVKFTLTCGSCGHEYRPEVDLNDLKVWVVENAQSLTTLHTMRDGFQIGGKTYHKLVLDPPRWNALSALKVKSSVLAEMAQLSSAIRYAVPLTDDEPPVCVSPAALDDCSKYDFEMIRKATDIDIGPDLVLDGVCPSCTATTVYGVDWSWDFFFKSPSL